jgi:hypothetical protein
MSQKTCLFCGVSLSEAGRAKEDVIPKWLLEHLGLDKSRDLIASSHLTDTGIPLKKPRVQGSHTILQGAVCTSCNGGWMSDLEGNAKQIVGNMSCGEPFKANRVDLITLATWIFKTAILFHISSNYRRLVPSRDFTSLYRNRVPPPGRHVEIAYLAAEPISAFRTRMSPIKALFLPTESDKEAISHEVDQSSYILTIQFGRLLTQVVGLPPFGAWGRAEGGRSSVFRIFPRVPETLAWPPVHGFNETIDGLNLNVALRLLPL